jgi:hypothetical protein
MICSGQLSSGFQDGEPGLLAQTNYIIRMISAWNSWKSVSSSFLSVLKYFVSSLITSFLVGGGALVHLIFVLPVFWLLFLSTEPESDKFH